MKLLNIVHFLIISIFLVNCTKYVHSPIEISKSKGSNTNIITDKKEANENKLTKEIQTPTKKVKKLESVVKSEKVVNKKKQRKVNAPTIPSSSTTDNAKINKDQEIPQAHTKARVEVTSEVAVTPVSVPAPATRITDKDNKTVQKKKLAKIPRKKKENLKSKSKPRRFSYGYSETVRTIEKCTISNCKGGFCIESFICQCQVGFVDKQDSQPQTTSTEPVVGDPKPILYCNYKQKSQLTSFLLEFIFPIGIGHLYAGRILNGILKMLLYILFPFILCGLMMCKTPGAEGK